MLILTSIFIICINIQHVACLFWNTPYIKTACGNVLGIHSKLDGAFSFCGIPYASPPIGKLRWRPPVPLKPANDNCWNTSYFSATSFGQQCFQRSDKHKHYVGSEDCLFINVWTPTLSRSAKLPVMFWIHGGYLLNGNGNEDNIGYAPSTKLAADTNTVYVSINYRLHAFGFMALEWLVPGSQTNSSGNYGIMDMIEGLRWVQDNIRKFGGDERKITVFGQSSGGTAIFALLASPLSKGLFHKAWLMSSSPILNKTAADAFKDNEIFISNTRCAHVDCLYNLTPQEVTSSVPWDVYPYWEMADLMDLPQRGLFDGALIIIDGYVLEESPFETWKKGAGNDVSILIGTTAQESDLDPRPVQVVNWKWTSNYVTKYEQYVRRRLGSFGDSVVDAALHLYPAGDHTPEFQLTSMISDVRVNCGNDLLSFIAARSLTSPVFRYVVTYIPTRDELSFVMGYPARYAFHNIDCLAFFGIFASQIPIQTVSDTEWQSNLRREVLAFVRTGKPASAQWQPYPATTALLSETTRITRGYHTEQCAFWLSNGFFSYSWIN